MDLTLKIDTSNYEFIILKYKEYSAFVKLYWEKKVVVTNVEHVAFLLLLGYANMLLIISHKRGNKKLNWD